jgi:hypothetical protein
VAGFEPAISSSRSWRIAQLSYTLNQSSRRELNPHVHHGKVAGYRYITAADCSEARSAGVEPTPSLYGRRCADRYTTTASHCKCARQESNLLRQHVRLACSRYTTVAFRSGRWDSNPRSPAPHAGGLPGFPTPCLESTLRDSNPHRRLGRTACCPLHHGCLLDCPIVKDHIRQGDRRESNPLAPGSQPGPCPFGIGHSALGGSRTHTPPFKRRVLCQSSSKGISSSRAGETRTLIVRIKSPPCCRYTTAPFRSGAGVYVGCVASFTSVARRGVEPLFAA